MTKVSIANMALAKFSEARLINFEENTPSAKVIRRQYDTAREEVLNDAKWPFAIKRAVLPRVVIDTSDDWGDWTYAYQLPDDFIQVVSVNDLYPEQLPEPSWIVEGLTLRTNGKECKLRYIHDAQDVNQFSVQFRRAFVLKLAAMVSPIVRGDPAFGQAFDQEYWQLVLPIAQATDENQNQFQGHEPEFDSSFLRARYQ